MDDLLPVEGPRVFLDGLHYMLHKSESRALRRSRD
jgi:hypothetical protein